MGQVSGGWANVRSRIHRQLVLMLNVSFHPASGLTHCFKYTPGESYTIHDPPTAGNMLPDYDRLYYSPAVYSIPDTFPRITITLSVHGVTLC